MTLGLMDRATTDRFNRLCRRVAGATTGRGVTLNEIGDAAALARELEKDEPDPERVDLFRHRLGLDGVGE